MESDKCRKSRWYEIRSSKIRRFFLLFLKRPECPFILSRLIVQFAKVRALSNHLMYEKPQVNSASRVFIITSIYIFPVVLFFHCLMCVYFIRYRDRVGWNRFFFKSMDNNNNKEKQPLLAAVISFSMRLSIALSESSFFFLYTSSAAVCLRRPLGPSFIRLQALGFLPRPLIDIGSYVNLFFFFLWYGSTLIFNKMSTDISSNAVHKIKEMNSRHGLRQIYFTLFNHDRRYTCKTERWSICRPIHKNSELRYQFLFVPPSFFFWVDKLFDAHREWSRAWLALLLISSHKADKWISK